MSNLKVAKLLARGGDLCSVVGILLFSAAYKSRSYGRNTSNRPLPGMLFLVVSLVANAVQLVPYFAPGDTVVQNLYKTWVGEQGVVSLSTIFWTFVLQKDAFQLLLKGLCFVVSLTLCISNISIVFKPAHKESGSEEAPQSALERSWTSIFLAIAAAMVGITLKSCADDGFLKHSNPDMAELAHIVVECFPRQGGVTQLLEVLAIGPQLLYLDDGFGHGVALRLVTAILMLAAWYALGQFAAIEKLSGVSKLQRLSAAVQVITLATFLLPNYAKRNAFTIIAVPINAAVLYGLYTGLSYVIPMMIDSSSDYPIFSQALSALSFPMIDTFSIDDYYRYLTVLCVFCVGACVLVGGTTSIVCSMALVGMLAI